MKESHTLMSEFVDSEIRLLKDYNNLKLKLQEWGDFVDNELNSLIRGSRVPLSIQIFPCNRLKEDRSVIGRALYRDIDSSDPLKRIEDKIATRIVATSLLDVQILEQIITNEDNLYWTARVSRSLQKKLNNPNSFEYQAVHIILKPNTNCAIFTDFSKKLLQKYTCEVQVRSLLQHAFAEVAHDTIYKGPYSNSSKLVRLLSKGQALMEVTDEYFLKAYELMSDEKTYEEAFLASLTEIWAKINGESKPRSQKIDIELTNIIFEEFEILKIDVDEVKRTIQINSDILTAIFGRSDNLYIYDEPVVIVIIYSIYNNLQKVLNNWTLDPEILSSIAHDLGYSIRR